MQDTERTAGQPDDKLAKFETMEQRAVRHKRVLVNALGAVVAAAEEARQDGFEVQFGMNIDAYGRYAVMPPVTIVKRY